MPTSPSPVVDSKTPVDPGFTHTPYTTSWFTHHSDASLLSSSNRGSDVVSDIAPLRYPHSKGGATNLEALFQDTLSYQAYAAGIGGVASIVCKATTLYNTLCNSFNPSSTLGCEIDSQHDYRGDTCAVCPALGILATAAARTTSFYSFASDGESSGKTPFRQFEASVYASGRLLARNGNRSCPTVGSIKWAPSPVLARIESIHGNNITSSAGRRSPLYFCASMAGGCIEVVACARLPVNVGSKSSAAEGSLPFSSTEVPCNLASQQSLHFVRAPKVNDKTASPPLQSSPLLLTVPVTLLSTEALKVHISPNVALPQEELAVATATEITVNNLDAHEKYQVGGPPKPSTARYKPLFKRSITDYFFEDKGVLQDMLWLSDRHLMVVTATSVGIIDVWERMSEAMLYTEALSVDAIVKAGLTPKEVVTERESAKRGAKRTRDEEEEENTAKDGDERRRQQILLTLSRSRKSVLLGGTVYTCTQMNERVATFYPRSADHFKSRSLGAKFGLVNGGWADREGRYVIPHFVPSANGSSITECSFNDLPSVATQSPSAGKTSSSTRSWVVAVGGVSTHIGDLVEVSSLLAKDLTATPIPNLLSPGVIYLSITLTSDVSTRSKFDCIPIGQWNGPSRSTGCGFAIDYCAPTALSISTRTLPTNTNTSGSDNNKIPPQHHRTVLQVVMCGPTLLTKIDRTGAKAIVRYPQSRLLGKKKGEIYEVATVPNRTTDQRLNGYTWVMDVTMVTTSSTDESSGTPPPSFNGSHSALLKAVRPLGQNVRVNLRAQWPIMHQSDRQSSSSVSHSSSDLRSFEIYKQDPAVRKIQSLLDITPTYNPAISNDAGTVAAGGFLLVGQHAVSFVSSTVTTGVEAAAGGGRAWGLLLEASASDSLELPEGDTISRATIGDYRWMEMAASTSNGGGGDGAIVNKKTSSSPPNTFSPIGQIYADSDRTRFSSISSVLSRFSLDSTQWDINVRRVAKRSVGSVVGVQNDLAGKRRTMTAIGGLVLIPNSDRSSSSEKGGWDNNTKKTAFGMGFTVAALFRPTYEHFDGVWLSHAPLASSATEPQQLFDLPSLDSALSTVATSAAIAFHSRRRKDAVVSPSSSSCLDGAPLPPSIISCTHTLADLFHSFKTVVYGAMSVSILAATQHRRMETVCAKDLLLMCAPSSSSTGSTSSYVPRALLRTLSKQLLYQRHHIWFRDCVQDGEAPPPLPLSSSLPAPLDIHVPSLCLTSSSLTTIDNTLDSSVCRPDLARAINEGGQLLSSLSLRGGESGESVFDGFLDPVRQLQKIGRRVAEEEYEGDLSQHYSSIVCELQLLCEIYLRRPEMQAGGVGNIPSQSTELAILATNDGKPSLGKEGLGLALFRKFPSPSVSSSSGRLVQSVLVSLLQERNQAPAVESTTAIAISSTMIPVWEASLQRALLLACRLPPSAVCPLGSRMGIVQELLLGRAVGMLDQICLAIEGSIKGRGNANTAAGTSSIPPSQQKYIRLVIAGDTCAALITLAQNSSSERIWVGKKAQTLGSVMPGVVATTASPSAATSSNSLVARWERSKKAISPDPLPFTNLQVVSSLDYYHDSNSCSNGYDNVPSQLCISMDVIKANSNATTTTTQSYLLNAFFEIGSLRKGIVRGTWGRRCGLCGQVSPATVGGGGGGGGASSSVVTSHSPNIAPSVHCEGNKECSLCGHEFTPETSVMVSC